MWALVQDNAIQKVYMRPTGLTIGDVNYPKNVMSQWSSSELESIGLYEVVVDNTNFKDKTFYINTNQTFTFADNAVTATYGEATPKPLDDATDEDGNVVRGLKYQHKVAINGQASGILASTDWYVIREADGGTEVPADINNYRTAVRTKANEMCSLIDGVANVDALAALYVYDEDGNRPLGEFPTL